MKRSKNQAIFKFLPEMWVSDGGSSSNIAMTSKIYQWNTQPMENIYNSFIESEINRQISMFGERGGDISSFDISSIEKFSIVEPKCIDGVPDIYGKISPLFFYCNKCGNTFSLSSSKDIPAGIWKCPDCHEGLVRQLQMIYTCECGYAEPISLPYEPGNIKMKYRPTDTSFKVFYKKGGVERSKEFYIKCKNCGNNLRPDNVVSSRNYKPFYVKTINLVEKNQGVFYERGLAAYKVVVSRWFKHLSEDGYNKIIKNVYSAFDKKNILDEKRKEYETPLLNKGYPKELVAEFVNAQLKSWVDNNPETVEQCCVICDDIFKEKRVYNEKKYNDWLAFYSYNLMQYYTLLDSNRKITLEESIQKQLELELIDDKLDVINLNNKLGIRDMQVSNDVQLITVVYGYTRKTQDPKQAQINNRNCKLKLNSFLPNKDGKKYAYGSKLDTEGILFQIDLKKIILWLKANGIIREEQIPDLDDYESIQKWYADNIHSENISSFANVDEDIITSSVFGLLHSMSHAFIRGAGEISGISSNSISEIIFVETASIFIYSQSTQGVPLGALSGMAEFRYYQFLKNVYNDSRNCIFDPICEQRDDSACSGCLIIPETTCSYFNNTLGRKYLYSYQHTNLINVGFWEM